MRVYWNGPLLLIFGTIIFCLVVRRLVTSQNERTVQRPPHVKVEDTIVRKEERKPVEKIVKNEEKQPIENNEERKEIYRPQVLQPREDPFDSSMFARNVIRNEWKAKVVQSVDGKWTEEKCQIRADFKRANLEYVSTPIFVYNTTDDKTISGSVIKYGSWQSNLVQNVVKILTADLDLVFVDIGANLGVYSLAAAATGNRVVAVDCCRGNIMRLCASMRAGKLRDRMVIVHNAVTDKRGKFEPKTQMAEMSTGVHKIEENTVNSILLDDLLASFVVDKVDVVLRIDAGNYEAKVLKGADKFFDALSVKYLLIDIKSHRENNDGKFILGFLDRNNMDIVHDGKYDKANVKTWPDTILCKKRNIKSEF